MPSLILNMPDGKELECDLGKEQVLIGRGEECDLVLTSESVSVQHATLAPAKGEPGIYVLTDLGSTNGIKINGVKVDRAELSGGEVVKIGGIQGEFVGEGGKSKKGSGPSGEEGDRGSGDEKKKEEEEDDDRPRPGRPRVTKGSPPPAGRKPGPPSKEEAPLIRAQAPGRPGGVRRRRHHVEEDSQAYAWFFAAVLVALAVLLALCLRHFFETGGFFPTDFYDKIRVIEVAPQPAPGGGEQGG